MKKVEDGSTLVTQSGQTLEQIVTSVKEVSDIVGEIAAASREQSSGIGQVNKAVMQMDEMDAAERRSGRAGDSRFPVHGRAGTRAEPPDAA